MYCRSSQQIPTDFSCELPKRGGRLQLPASQMDDYSAQPEPIRVYENTYKLALDDGTKFAMRPGARHFTGICGKVV